MRYSFLLLLTVFCTGVFSPLPLGAEPDKKTLRVLSYNAWYGFTKKPERKVQWLDWMKERKPDVVSLQEMNKYTAATLEEDAKAWGHKYSVILKEDGFPTGLTSRFPINDVVRIREGFKHGLLRARTAGVTVYVIHLHPSNWEVRVHEVQLLLKDMATLEKGTPVLLVGDFNTFSPQDAEFYSQDKEIEPFFADRDKNLKEKNLNKGKLDFDAIGALLKAGLIDLEHRFRKKDGKFTGTFPTLLRKDENHGTARRLDYIFANTAIAGRCVAAESVVDKVTGMLSDHYPVYADFNVELPD